MYTVHCCLFFNRIIYRTMKTRFCTQPNSLNRLKKLSGYFLGSSVDRCPIRTYKNNVSSGIARPHFHQRKTVGFDYCLSASRIQSLRGDNISVKCSHYDVVPLNFWRVFQKKRTPSVPVCGEKSNRNPR